MLVAETKLLALSLPDGAIRSLRMGDGCRGSPNFPAAKRSNLKHDV